MAAARVFQVALIDRVRKPPDWFGYSTKNEITYTIFDYLIQIARVTPGKFVPGPGWSYGPSHVQAHDVVVYFVYDRSESILLSELGVTPRAGAGGGFTYISSAATVCEVYINDSMPAHRLANCAFHEVMHNVLAVGDGMHSLGGVAASPTPERAILTAESIRRMSARMFLPRPQFLGRMQE